MKAWADNWLDGDVIPHRQARKEFNEALAKHEADHEAADAVFESRGKVDGLAMASAKVMKSAALLWQVGEDEAARTLRGVAQTLAAMAEAERRKL